MDKNVTLQILTQDSWVGSSMMSVFIQKGKIKERNSNSGDLR